MSDYLQNQSDPYMNYPPDVDEDAMSNAYPEPEEIEAMATEQATEQTSYILFCIDGVFSADLPATIRVEDDPDVEDPWALLAMRFPSAYELITNIVMTDRIVGELLTCDDDVLAWYGRCVERYERVLASGDRIVIAGDMATVIYSGERDRGDWRCQSFHVTPREKADIVLGKDPVAEGWPIDGDDRVSYDCARRFRCPGARPIRRTLRPSTISTCPRSSGTVRPSCAPRTASARSTSASGRRIRRRATPAMSAP